VPLLHPCKHGKRTGKKSPFCSSSLTILPRSSVVICEHGEYPSEVIENGEKESTQDIKTRVQDLSGGQRRQNRAVPFCQGSPAAQENGCRRNHDKEIAHVLAHTGRAATIQRSRSHPRWLG